MASVARQDAATVAKSFGLLPGEADDFMDAFHLCRCGGAAGVNAIPSATMRKILPLAGCLVTSCYTTTCEGDRYVCIQKKKSKAEPPSSRWLVKFTFMR